MKHFKKMMALVIALVMIVGTMVPAFAAETIVPEGLEADTTVTINGLDKGDTVNLYQLVKWSNNADNTSAGWVLTDTFKDDDACKAVLARINAKTDGVYTLTQDDVKAFTDVLNNGTKPTAVTGGSVSDAGVYTNSPIDTGMYIALVKPATAGTLYNPIIVSADYFNNGTNEIDASSASLSTAVAKKETLDVQKEEEDDDDNTEYSYDVGDNVGFTVTTTIPTYAEIYENPSFKVTDELSTGLVLDASKGIKVYKEDGTTEIATLTSAVTANGTSGWTLNVPSSYIKALEAPQKIVIKYEATLTESNFTSVNEETNDVKVEFSNNPNDDTEKGTVKDKTRTYTFSIDGKLLGNTSVDTSELVKVAVDGNGDPILQSSSTNETYTNALAGAKFGLYTDSSATIPYTNTSGKDFTNIMTDSDGYMEINGLDAGTYYLKEITAPAGFIKDQTIHEIVISATYKTESHTEDGYTYDLQVLDTYTITIDGNSSSTYTMTLDGSDIKTSSISASNALLNNTKGVELPSTGGMGTTLFYIIGAVLVLGAGILLVTRRRMSAN